MSGVRYDRLVMELFASGKLLLDGDWLLVRRAGPPFMGRYAPATFRRNHDGYLITSLRVGSRRLNLRVHRVVWLAHHGPTFCEIDHVNDLRDDPRLSNLFPLTHAENTAKAWERRRAFERGKIPSYALTPDERRPPAPEPF